MGELEEFWESVTKVIKVGQENLTVKKYFLSTCLRELKSRIYLFNLLNSFATGLENIAAIICHNNKLTSSLS